MNKRLNLLCKIYNVDIKDISLANEFIDSIIDDFDINYKPKKIIKEFTIDSENMICKKPRRFYYKDGMNHIYKYLDSKTKNRYITMNVRDILFTAKILLDIISMDDKRYILYLKACDPKHYEIYSCEKLIVSPFIRRGGRTSLFLNNDLPSIYSYSTYSTFSILSEIVGSKYFRLKKFYEIGRKR